jgi:hypothetical protein
MKIKYSKFEVNTSLELPLNQEEWHEILMNEYFKHHIEIRPKNSEHSTSISKDEVFLWHVQELLSGDEQRATEALRSIIYNREQRLNILRKAL